MRATVIAGLIVATWATSLSANAVETSIRPVVRPDAAVISGAQLAKATSVRGDQSMDADEGQPVNQRFQNWISAFKRRAEEQGIEPQVLEQAFRAVHYDADVIRRDRNQSEFTKTIWEYLDTAVSPTRIANGKSALQKHGATLNEIEAKYGVDKQVVVAIWGLESAYGGFRGSNNVIESLSTLAFDSRRGAFFEGQLIAALRILQSGDTNASSMTGSWAGAMGHTQFMPTSYLDYAVDHTGDGKRNIWGDDPSDALASTAAYLAHFGWTKGQPWGVEVALPDGFDFTQASRKITRSPADWAGMGIRNMAGNPVPDHGKASILLPAGGQGAAFMIFDNFAVIEQYNTADAYVIGVGHLGDRIAGGPAIQATWPRQDRALTFKERKEMQQRLTQAGFDTQKIDGKIGPLTIAAVRAYQVANGLLPDGYASLRILNALR